MTTRIENSKIILDQLLFWGEKLFEQILFLAEPPLNSCSQYWSLLAPRHNLKPQIACSPQKSTREEFQSFLVRGYIIWSVYSTNSSQTYKEHIREICRGYTIASNYIFVYKLTPQYPLHFLCQRFLLVRKILLSVICAASFFFPQKLIKWPPQL